MSTSTDKAETTGPADHEQRDRRLWGWMQLVRPPNLFSVPGDPLAGMALVAGSMTFAGVYAKAGGVILAALLLYAAGLVLNDWCDRHIDAVERPDRPIPAGLVPAGQALAAAIALMLAAIAVAGLILSPAAGLVALALAGLIVSYNAFAKRIPILGIPNMALCRSASILLGGAAVIDRAGGRSQWLWVAAVVIFVYIVLVSLVALHETDRLPAKWLLILLAAFPFLLLASGLQRLSGDGCPYVWVAWVLSALYLWHIVKSLWQNTVIERTPMFIGHLIRNLIFMQAFWIAAGGGFCFWLAGILLLWPLSGVVGKWFYSS